ncbi:MAG: radical SAM protein [Patescibacteria group bacterium]|nr:radical SAM protein [Patescibacteria group bacterium]MDD5554888.1 radical SAM protein [Patescibacteria group bacterium]
MKILIINPPAFRGNDYIREGRCMQTKSSWASLWMPLSLAYIAAFLRKEGSEIKLIDCIAKKMKAEKLIKIAKDFSPGLIVINTAFPSIKGDMETAARFKKALPSAKIASIGLYPTLFEDKFLEEFSTPDFAVIGEPEWVIKNLVKTLEIGENLDKVDGLIWRKTPTPNPSPASVVTGEGSKSDIVVNQPQKIEENDLDELPFPARDLLNNEAYRLPTDRKKFTLLSVGRGCPFNCSYCAAHTYYGKKFRRRTVKSVIDEIEECLNKYGIKSFLFWGESFTLDYLYGEAICDEIMNRGLKITWSAASRADTLNEKLLKKMKQAGCILLGLGIESANQEVLDRAKKGISLEKIKRAIKMVKEAGISSMGHFVFGLPGDTKESAKETMKFACGSGVNYAQFYCAIPYPKTELGRIAKKNDWIETKNYSEFDLTKSVMRNEALSSAQIKKFRDKAYRKFYFRPKMIKQTMKEVSSFRSFLEILNFMKWIKPKS